MASDFSFLHEPSATSAIAVMSIIFFIIDMFFFGIYQSFNSISPRSMVSVVSLNVTVTLVPPTLEASNVTV